MSEGLLEREKLAKVVSRLTSSFEVYAIVLVGSRACGGYKPWSDYDAVVIAGFKENYLARMGRIFGAIR